MLWISDGPPRGIRQSTYVGELHDLDRGLVARRPRRAAPRRRAARPWRAPSRSTVGDREVRAQRARRAAQERGVARLQAEAGGVAGDVGPVLVDDRDDAERHPHPLDLEAVGPASSRRAPRRPGRAARRPCAGRRPCPRCRASVRRSRSSGPGSMPAGRPRRRGRRALAARISAAALAEQVGGGEQRGVLRRRSTRRQHPAAPPSPAAPARRTAACADIAPSVAVTARPVLRRSARVTERATSGRACGSGGVRPCRRTQPRCPIGRSGRGDPASPSSRSSPTVEALAEDSPPAGRRRAREARV